MRKASYFTVTGRARIKRSSTSETTSGLTAKLTKAGASRLNRTLHTHAFRAAESFGSFTVKVCNSPVTGTAGGAGRGCCRSGHRRFEHGRRSHVRSRVPIAARLGRPG